MPVTLRNRNPSRSRSARKAVTNADHAEVHGIAPRPVAHGADHRRASVRGPVAGASGSGHQAAALARSALAVCGLAVLVVLVLVGPRRGAGPVTGLAPR